VSGIHAELEAGPPEVLELLRQRAERLRSTERANEEGAVLWVAEFPVGEDRYAIALDSLRAALPLRTVTPVPLASSRVIGILRYHGQIITALSLASLLGLSGWRHDPAFLVVLDAGGGHLVAIDCEEIPRAMAIPLHAVEQARTRAKGALIEVMVEGLRQVLLIDAKQLLREERREATDGR
jgi:chemotaxis signal transduction protein